MEGARWDIQSGIITESRLKELFPSMPVINVRVTVTFRRTSISLRYFKSSISFTGNHSRQAGPTEYL